MRAQKLVNGLERDLQLAQAERRVGARIQPDVGQLFIGQRDVLIGQEGARGLHIMRR